MYVNARTLTEVRIIPASPWQRFKGWIYRDLDRSFVLRGLADWLSQRSPVITDKVRFQKKEAHGTGA